MLPGRRAERKSEARTTWVRLRRLVLLLLVFVSSSFSDGRAALANRFDPLKVRVHESLRGEVDEALVRDWFARSDAILQFNQTLDPNRDVPCDTSFELIEVVYFGEVGDDFEYIGSRRVFEALLERGAGVFVVPLLRFCSSVLPNLLGCAPIPGDRLIIAYDEDRQTAAETIAHERGHNAGLSHRDDDSCALMRSSVSAFVANGCIDNSECNAFLDYAYPTGTSCSYTGKFSRDDQAQAFDFTIESDDTDFTARSYGFGGGTNRVSRDILDNGLDGIFTIFSASDLVNPIIEGDDYFVDGFKLSADPRIEVNLDAGDYRLILTQFDNFWDSGRNVFSMNEPDFTDQWDCSREIFCSSIGSNLKASWAIELFNVATVESGGPGLAPPICVPEPTQESSIIAALGGIAWLARRRRRAEIASQRDGNGINRTR